ncbi:TIM44-like domain-containing protein [Pyxidicoccus xibeiensis]|uniref:TIM44-like domain-containing protein n=1 Tax=Pyxidicoccus xibeiensis TaxID=2906759 RepID=UPI0020A70FAC|nr:TIM44-like domain-containing protein [Pyxidicoccus xibeiensis]MCP3139121.1 TIM44-like domain-containing protein [Pyxidicoccus xibeiensis]
MLLRLLVFLTVLLPLPALAGPGGKIVSAAFRSPLGRVVLIALALILLPLLVYVAVKEWRAERRTRAALKTLGAIRPEFDWLTLNDRVVECFHRIHSAWRRAAMREASDWMTDWYWQNQQLVHLDRWEREGLVNRCTVNEVKRVRPLMVACRNEDGQGGGSRVVVAITAEMEDYLESCITGHIVEGKKGFTEATTVWTFVLHDGRWRVNNIEPDAMTLTYASVGNELEALLAPSSQVTRARDAR